MNEIMFVNLLKDVKMCIWVCGNDNEDDVCISVAFFSFNMVTLRE